MKFEPINGYTKESIIKIIDRDFKGQAHNGKVCVYLTNRGKRCAVGLFIPADNIPAQFHNGGVSSLLDAFPELEKEMPLNVTALVNFQHFHDHFLSPTSSVETQKKQMIQWIMDNVK